jgi:hypothetical protein
MSGVSRVFRRVFPLVVFGILFTIGVKVSGLRAVQSSNVDQSVSLVVWTDRSEYSIGEALQVNAALQNDGDQLVYVDRRMFWTGFGGGLKLEIRDEQGKSLPVRPLSDAIMPPPKEEDMSVLIRLDSGFLYGTSERLQVKDFFSKPGDYSIRVIYKSWLRKELVASQLRNLPALWADTREIVSKPVRIHVSK